MFAGLGETGKAVQWLERAFEERDVHMPFLLDHKWDGMRGDAYFKSLQYRVGLPLK